MKTHINPNSEIRIGSTGDPPVPSGHWPDGRDRTLALNTEARKIPGAFPVPSGGSPLGTGQWPVLPTKMATATSESGIKNLFLLPALLAGLGLMPAARVTAQTFTTLYNFGGNFNPHNPEGGLVLSGNTLYGKTTSGGSSGHGTVFAVNTDGSGFTLLHDFTGGDGYAPVAGLLLSGNTLYGTTVGGSSGAATVFAVNTDGMGFLVLHVFTGDEGNSPQGDLILAGNTLYGTTMFGGTNGTGTVFSIALPPPQLAITPAGADVVLTWPVSATGFTLQSATNLISPVFWSTVSPGPVVVSGQNTVTNPISGTQQFYRLSQ